MITAVGHIVPELVGLEVSKYISQHSVSDRESCHLGIEGPSVTGTMEQVFHERSTRL
jgi:hypothetical protein